MIARCDAYRLQHLLDLVRLNPAFDIEEANAGLFLAQLHFSCVDSDELAGDALDDLRVKAGTHLGCSQIRALIHERAIGSDQ